MTINNYFRRQSELVKENKRLEALVELTSAEVVRLGDINDRLQQDIQVIEAENAHLRRVVGGYKAGQARRANTAEATHKDALGGE